MSPYGAVRIGFASFDLKDTFSPKKPFHDPLEGQVFYACGEQQALWFSLDVTMFPVPFCLQIREAIAGQLNMSASQIVLHSTHNHTGPDAEEMLQGGHEKWVHCLVKAARQAMDNAEPACMAHIRQKIPEGIFIRRRQNFGLNLGDLCNYMGYELRNGRPDATRVNTCRIGQWLGGALKQYAEQIPVPMLYDRPIDECLEMLLFRSTSGRPLGAVVRFAAHVIIAGHCPRPQYSADFPGVLRSLVQSHFGGICLCVNGPCGDITLFEQVPFRMPEPTRSPEPSGPLWMPHASERDTWHEVERIGRELFAPLSMADCGSFEKIREMSIVEKELHLPMRSDIVDLEIAKKLCQEHLDHFLERVYSRALLREIKQEVEFCRFYSYHEAFYGSCRCLYPEDLARKQIRCFVSALRLGRVCIVGLPAEVFMETGETIRNAVEKDGTQCITATECNGEIAYIPTPKDISGGDYEPAFCVVTKDAERLLSDTTIDLVATH